MRFKDLLWCCLVVLPLRNGHYYDGMKFVEKIKEDLVAGQKMSAGEISQYVDILQQRVADRSVAADVTLAMDGALQCSMKRVGCLRCDRRFHDPMLYLFHHCCVTKNKENVDSLIIDAGVQGSQA